MPLTQRSFSLNSFCLSKIWFRTASVNLREKDCQQINSQVKAWLFSDQLELPEQHVLYRPRNKGGLNLIHVKYKAISELIRSFLETAVNKDFILNALHTALFRWNILHQHDIPNLGNHPFISEEVFSLIREVKVEGLLDVAKMKSGDWYKVLLENKVTMQFKAD